MKTSSPTATGFLLETMEKGFPDTVMERSFSTVIETGFPMEMAFLYGHRNGLPSENRLSY